MAMTMLTMVKPVALTLLTMLIVRVTTLMAPPVRAAGGIYAATVASV